ncbi:unnamed protein product [Lactuca saligna]|uniref:Uncharacterized protein n=1 Tax=Lactuca saligna TaxID=75948 RepID=A0AA35VCP1_LACSI|nr:unnamed protein product [Lactuca saligna]
MERNRVVRRICRLMQECENEGVGAIPGYDNSWLDGSDFIDGRCPINGEEEWERKRETKLGKGKGRIQPKPTSEFTNRLHHKSLVSNMATTFLPYWSRCFPVSPSPLSTAYQFRLLRCFDFRITQFYRRD